VSDFPIRAERVDPIDRQTRKLIEDAERAVAMHHADLTEFARQILAGRKQRERFFDPVLFSNPAWDILLNLYLADADGQSVDLFESCGPSAVPHGVALRWLAYLKQEEMVIEIPDPAQTGRTVIQLSEQTRLTISAYLGSLISLGLGSEHILPGNLPTQD